MLSINVFRGASEQHLIQDRSLARNIDSKNAASGFDCCPRAARRRLSRQHRSKADVIGRPRVGPLGANSGHKPDQPARIRLEVNPLWLVSSRAQSPFHGLSQLAQRFPILHRQLYNKCTLIPPPYIACWAARKPITAMIDFYERRTAAVAGSPVLEVEQTPPLMKAPPHRSSPKTSSVR